MHGNSMNFSASAEDARTMRKQLHAARWEAERQRCYLQHRRQRKLAKETWRHVRQAARSAAEGGSLLEHEGA